jgi:VanZ family protein
LIAAAEPASIRSGLNTSKWLKIWWPVLLTMTLIFIGSSDLLSSGNTSGTLGRLLRVFFPAISENAVDLSRFLIRKCGHLTEYAILAILVFRAFERVAADAGRAPDFSWIIRATISIAALYAVTDEMHQSLVPSRMGTLLDVFIDTAGATVGATFWRIRSRRDTLVAV